MRARYSKKRERPESACIFHRQDGYVFAGEGQRGHAVRHFTISLPRLMARDDQMHFGARRTIAATTRATLTRLRRRSCAKYIREGLLAIYGP